MKFYNPNANVRVPLELKPGEFASLIATIEGVAKRQDRTPPQPEKKRA